MALRVDMAINQLQAPLFTVTIRNNPDSDPIIYNCDPDNSGVPWCLLVQVGNQCLIYDFGQYKFRLISYKEYEGYRSKFYSIEIRHRPTKSEWGEVPLTVPHPKRIFESEQPISKAKHRAITGLNQLGDLSRFIEVEDIPDELKSSINKDN